MVVSVTVFCGTAFARAQSADPVEELRLLLKAPLTDSEARDRALKEQGKLVDGINDLRRALVLRDWRDEDPDARVASVDQRNRAGLARRFEQAVREVLLQGDATSKLAVLNMLGKMGTNVRGIDTKN